MKSLQVLLVTLALALGTAVATAPGGALAADEKATEKATETKKATEAKKADKPVAAKSARGTVKSATADSLVVAGKEKGKDAEWTFALETKTQIKKGGKSVTAADLKAGDTVQVRYMDHDGKAMAQSVVVAAGGTDKNAAESAKKDAAMAKKDDKPADKK